MGEHEGFSLAPRDIIWPAAFAACLALVALSLDAFSAGSGIDLVRLWRLAPLLVVCALLFAGVDALLMLLDNQSRTEASWMFALDVALWVACIAILVIADSGPLVWWRFILPVLVGAAGASILDQGRGRGVMIATCVVVLAALGFHASGSPMDWAPVSPAFAWPALAVVGTFPFCAYLRLTHRRGTELHIAGSVTSAILAIALAFTATWFLAVRSPAARSSANVLQRQRTLSVVAAELTEHFVAAEASSEVPTLAQALSRYTSASGTDFYILRSVSGRSELILASKNVVRDTGVRRAEVTSDAAQLDSAELIAVLAAADAGIPRGGGLESPGHFAAPSTDWRYAGGPPLTEPIMERSTISTTTGTGGERLLLVATAGTPEWWRPLTPVEVAVASVSSIFPWLFYALLLPVMGSLLFFSRRQDTRAKLIEAEERSRIRLDTHDKVSNRLSAVAKRIEVASKTHSGREDAELKAAAEDIRGAVADLQIIVGDGPPAPPPGGVLAQLEQICRSQARQLGLDVTFSAPEDLPDLPVKLKWDLQCVVEEALTNAAKHGSAEHVDVSVEVRPLSRGGRSELCLKVADDGCGIALPIAIEQLGAEHHGLRGIERRAAAWNGSAGIVSEHGKTVLSVSVPLP